MVQLAEDRAHCEQLRLLPRTIDTVAASRAHVGDWGEAYIAAAIGGQRLQTTAGRLCPDVRAAADTWMEVKTVRAGRGVTIFRRSLDRYVRWTRDARATLRWAFVVHDLDPASCVTVDRLRDVMPRAISAVAVVSLTSVQREAAHVGWSYCDGRADGYRWATRLRWSWLRSMLVSRARNRMRLLPSRVYGRHVGYVPLRLWRTSLGIVGHQWWSAEHRRAAHEMLEDMEHSRLSVCLGAPWPGTHQRPRMVMARNTDWYRDLCVEYQRDDRRSQRRHGDTLIRRQTIASALRLISDGRPIRGGVSEGRLVPYLDRWIDGEYD